MQKLTERQKAVMDYTVESTTDRGYPPTLREIRASARKRRIEELADRAHVALVRGEDASPYLTAIDRERARENRTPRSAGEWLDYTIETIEAATDDQLRCRTGYPFLDRHFSARPGELTVIGAQTNTGKTSFVRAAAAAMHRCVPTAVISCEDGVDAFVSEWIAGVAGVPTAKIQDGEVDLGRIVEEHRDELAETMPHLRVSAMNTVGEVCSVMSEVVQDHGARAVFVDSLQALALPAGHDARSGTDANLGALIAHARRLGVALFLTCHLRRPMRPKQSKFHEPSMHDLKESGAIENRAQCIVMIWRDADRRVWAKVDKLKRREAPSKPVELTRDRIGRLVEATGLADFDVGPDDWVGG